MNTAVCLQRFYNDLSTDEERINFSNFYENFVISNNSLNDRKIISILTTLLLGPEEIGFKI